MMITEYSYSKRHELFLTTKLQLPSAIHPLVSRPRLLQRLNQGLERKLTLICAPAGSGKTTLFTDWLRSPPGREMPVAWLSLDEDDNDSTRFWRYVCTALKQIHPDIDEHVANLFETGAFESEVLLVRLINLLAEVTTPLILALDDFHLLTAASIQHELTFLFEYMPANMRIVLLTRCEPSLPLARLRLQGQVTDIREVDLRFTPDEVEQFFVKTMKLTFTPAHIKALADRTEGWIAGLRLAGLALRGQNDIDSFLVSFTGSSRYIVDYLLEEVLGRQLEAIQTFLLSTSILGRLCAPLCASILEATSASVGESMHCTSGSHPSDASRHCQEMLEYLERTNLFVIPLDDERRWYRYHRLFAGALHARLSWLHPSLVPQLHAHANAWYEQQGLLDEASKHVSAAENAVCDSRQSEASQQFKYVHELGQYPSERAVIFSQMLTPVPESRAGSSTGTRSSQQPLLDPLSVRELEALQLLASGATNATIAQQLVIAPATVKRHMSNIFSKLGAANRTQAVAYARNLGIL